MRFRQLGKHMGRIAFLLMAIGVVCLISPFLWICAATVEAVVKNQRRKYASKSGRVDNSSTNGPNNMLLNMLKKTR